MGSMRSRDRVSLARVLGGGPSAWCVRNNVQGARRLRLPPPGAGWPAAACGVPDTAGRGARLPLVFPGDATEGGSAQQRAARPRQTAEARPGPRAWPPTRTDRGGPVPTAGDPYRQSGWGVGKGSGENGRERVAEPLGLAVAGGVRRNAAAGALQAAARCRPLQ